jgi:GNAT superfamily N-acetyltransferase
VTEPRVRRAAPADAAAVARVHVRAWQGAYRGLLPDAFLDGLPATLSRREAAWGRILADPEQAVWVYPVAAEVAAFASVGPCRDDDKDPASVAELTALYALPEVWGQGVGRALWGAVLEHSRATGYREIALWVLTENARARRFYEAAGFRPDGHTKLEERAGFTLHETRYVRGILEGQ